MSACCLVHRSSRAAGLSPERLHGGCWRAAWWLAGACRLACINGHPYRIKQKRRNKAAPPRRPKHTLDAWWGEGGSVSENGGRGCCRLAVWQISGLAGCPPKTFVVCPSYSPCPSWPADEFGRPRDQLDSHATAARRADKLSKPSAACRSWNGYRRPVGQPPVTGAQCARRRGTWSRVSTAPPH